jgi:hypothetical protein
MVAPKPAVPAAARPIIPALAVAKAPAEPTADIIVGIAAAASGRHICEFPKWELGGSVGLRVAYLTTEKANELEVEGVLGVREVAQRAVDVSPLSEELAPFAK